MSIEVNGIAHIQLTVNDPERCIPFWENLCHFLGMKTLIRAEEIVYCIGSRTGVLVRGAPPEKRERAFDQDTPGLHHLCFRARQQEDQESLEPVFFENSAVSKLNRGSSAIKKGLQGRNPTVLLISLRTLCNRIGR